MEAKQLKELAVASGYRFTHLAKKLQVSKSTFTRYLSGEINIPSEKERILLSIINK